MNNPRTARESVRIARCGATLRPAQWDLIEEYFTALIARGIHEPVEIYTRLERRGQLERRGRPAEIDCVTDEPYKPIHAPGECVICDNRRADRDKR